MQQFSFIVRDPLGIHARPAGMLAKLAGSYTGTVVSITKGDSTVKATQLIKLMSLAIKCSDTVTVTVEGVEEEAAIAAIKTFFTDNL